MEQKYKKEREQEAEKVVQEVKRRIKILSHNSDVKSLFYHG